MRESLENLKFDLADFPLFSKLIDTLSYLTLDKNK